MRGLARPVDEDLARAGYRPGNGFGKLVSLLQQGAGLRVHRLRPVAIAREGFAGGDEAAAHGPRAGGTANKPGRWPAPTPDPAKLPYAGVSRIRFEGTVSIAWPMALTIPPLLCPLQHGPRHDAQPGGIGCGDPRSPPRSSPSMSATHPGRAPGSRHDHRRSSRPAAHCRTRRHPPGSRRQRLQLQRCRHHAPARPNACHAASRCLTRRNKHASLRPMNIAPHPAMLPKPAPCSVLVLVLITSTSGAGRIGV